MKRYECRHDIMVNVMSFVIKLQANAAGRVRLRNGIWINFPMTPIEDINVQDAEFDYWFVT